MILSVGFLLCTFSLSTQACQAPCLACICRLWQPGRCSEQASNKALQLPKQLSFREWYENQTAIILCCSLTIWCTVFSSQIIHICSFQKGPSVMQRVNNLFGCSKIWMVHNSMKLEETLLSTTWKIDFGIMNYKHCMYWTWKNPNLSQSTPSKCCLETSCCPRYLSIIRPSIVTQHTVALP